MSKKIIALIVIIIAVLLVILTFSGFFSYLGIAGNRKPSVEIIYPKNGEKVSKIVTISGTASDPDGDQNLQEVLVSIEDEWMIATGTTKWSYTWEIFDVENGQSNCHYRSRRIHCWSVNEVFP